MIISEVAFASLHSSLRPMPVTQTRRLLSWGPVAAAPAHCFRFMHCNYFYLESVASDSECLSCLSSGLPLIGKNDGSMERQGAGRWTERWKGANKNSSAQIKIYVKLCKHCKRPDSLKDAYARFTDLRLSLSNIHEHREICLRHDTVQSIKTDNCLPQ